MSALSVSVVIPSYDQAGYLREAVVSAIASADGGQVEVVVVDDASTDGSGRLVAALAEELGDVVRPVLLGRNGGGGAALNRGIAVADGDVVCFLDADDRFAPGKITAVGQVYADQPDAGWVFHRRRLIGPDSAPLPADDDPQDDGDGTAIPFGQLWHTGLLVRAGQLPYLPTSTSCLTARAGALRRLGPLPEHPGAVNDNVVKVLLALQSPGVFVPHRLADVRLHATNSYSGLARTWSQDAAMHLPTAADLVRSDPRLRLSAEGMVAGVVGRADTAWREDAAARAALRRYLVAAGPGSRRRILRLAARMAAKAGLAQLRARRS